MLANNEKRENQQDVMNSNILVNQSTKNHPEKIVRLRLILVRLHIDKLELLK